MAARKALPTTTEGLTEAQAVARFGAYVKRAAKRYASHGVPTDDLEQEGALAVVIAHRKWQAAGGANFATYACEGVESALKAAVRDTNGGDMRREGSGESETWITERKISMDQERKVDGDSSTFTLHDILPAQSAETPDALALAALPDLVAKLPARERCVIRQRFIEQRSQRDIGEKIGVSHQHVQRIEAAALDRLRRWVNEAKELAS